MTFVKSVDGFSNKAKGLRAFFDQQYEDPRRTSEKRFVWDYWHVPGHYQHLRTPAYHFFPKKIYDEFHTQLVHWGREHLGCHDISPTWLSLYPEGSFQNQHVDEPHGPFAFVYSLTLNPKSFKGGRTFVSKTPNLSKGRGRSGKLEWNLPVEKMKHKISVEPKFNRLIVFDPSYPHGVSKVSGAGASDPQKMRLVLHGWFVQPRPFWYGPLKIQDIQGPLDKLFALPHVQSQISGLHKVHHEACHDAYRGYLGLRLKILKTGRVSQVQTLVSTMAQTPAFLLDEIKALQFRKCTASTTLTLPVVVD